MATKSKKKSVTKKPVAKKTTTKKASAGKKPAAKKSAVTKKAVVLPATKLAKAFVAVKAETKSLIDSESKKLSGAKQTVAAATKKLKLAQDGLKKLEAKNAGQSDNTSKNVVKQLGTAKSKVKQAEAVLKNAEDAYYKVSELVSSYQNHLQKIAHLEKLVNTADREWEQQKQATPKLGATSKATASKTVKNTSSNKTSKTSKANSKSSDNKNNKKSTMLPLANSVLASLDSDEAWEKFEQKDNSVFGKMNDLAEFDSAIDELDSPWRKVEEK